MKSRSYRKWWLTFWLSLIPLFLSVFAPCTVGRHLPPLVVGSSLLTGIVLGRLWNDFYVAFYQKVIESDSKKGGE